MRVDVVLVRVRPDGRTDELKLKQPRTVIGRDEACDVRIPVAAVSRRHCELTVAAGAVTLRDLGSSNGTFINQQPIADEARVQAGDVITIGPMVFIARIDGEPRDIAAGARTRMASGGGLTAAKGVRPTPPLGAAPGAGLGAGLGAAAGAGLSSSDPEDSSFFDFDLDLSDDDEDDKQPPL